MRRQWFPANPYFTLNPHSQQARGLIAWWPMNVNRERSLLLRDLSGRDNHATMNALNWRAERLGWSPYFCFSPSTRFATASGVPSPANVTIAIWTMPKQYVTYQMQLTRLGAAGTDWEFAIQGSGFYYGYNGGNIVNGSLFSTAADTWQHIAMTVGPEGAVLYNMGRYVNKAAGTTFRSAAGTIYMGARSDGYYAESYIADIRMYDYQMSAKQIWNLYNIETRWELYRSIFDIGSRKAGGGAVVSNARSFGVVIG